MWGGSPPFLPERPRETKGGKSPSSPDFLATLINYRLTQDKPGKGERGDYGGQKSSPFTLLLHCRGRGGRRGGPDIISIIPPLPFPGGIRSGHISSSSSESILPLYYVGGGVSPLPSFSFRDDFLASFLGVEINDAVTIPKPKPNRKAVEFKVFKPFFPSV